MTIRMIIAAAVITLAALFGAQVLSANVWHRYGGWGFSIGAGCSGIGYIHQPRPEFAQDSGWFTDLCE